MSSLVLGVEEKTYTDNSGTPKVTTTGDVAEILEARYHVMQSFFNLRKGEIAEILADSMAARIKAMFRGNEKSSWKFGVEQKIERQFRSFILANEMQKWSLGLTGSPVSAAAMRGVNSRLKHPYTKKNKARPAFVDTGLYISSFRSELKL